MRISYYFDFFWPFLLNNAPRFISLFPIMPCEKKRTIIIITIEKTTILKPFLRSGTLKLPMYCSLSRNLSHHSEHATYRKVAITEPDTEPIPPITTISSIS